MIRKTSLFWGDILFYTIFPILISCIFFCQRMDIKLTDSLLVKCFFFIFLIFIGFALVRLLFVRKRELRDWIYLLYGIVTMIYLVPLAFSVFEGAFQEQEYVELALRLMQIVLYSSNTIRFVVWLAKQSQQGLL